MSSDYDVSYNEPIQVFLVIRMKLFNDSIYVMQTDSRSSNRLHSNAHNNNNARQDEEEEEDDDEDVEDDDVIIDNHPHPHPQSPQRTQAGKMYTFMSPPRNAPVRMVERSRQLDPKKLQVIYLIL